MENEISKWSRIWLLLSPVFALAILSLYITVTGSAQLDANPDIAAWWSFEEGSGNTTDDISQNINTGTLKPDCSTSNCPTWVTGKKSNGMQFDGVDEYIDILPSSSLDLVSKISIETWVNHTVSASQFIVSKRISGSDDAYELATCTSPVGEACFAVFIGNVRKFVESDEALSLNTWHHIVGTYDSINLKIYVDGVLKNTVPQTGNIDTTTDPVRIGWGYDNSYAWKGVIDNVRIWNRALTADEVASLYAKGGG
ncbi:MAG: LamG domain-containing protein [Candidatus Aenigmarchaeota archaeon]|nr:LamG domain-containing protein [Candidatus Aenigmarchaeota archaeon]